MAVRKNPAGGWICELYPNGAKGKRIRKKFATKGEALAFEQYTVQNPWQEEKADRRTLKELIDAWYSAHGITLKAVLNASWPCTMLLNAWANRSRAILMRKCFPAIEKNG